MEDVIVIGGGPAGMLAAIGAALFIRPWRGSEQLRFVIFLSPAVVL